MKTNYTITNGEMREYLMYVLLRVGTNWVPSPQSWSIDVEYFKDYDDGESMAEDFNTEAHERKYVEQNRASSIATDWRITELGLAFVKGEHDEAKMG